MKTLTLVLKALAACTMCVASAAVISAVYLCRFRTSDARRIIREAAAFVTDANGELSHLIGE